MKVFDRDKLIKVLGMLGSTHDGEALQAARKAHEIVRNSGQIWKDIISSANDQATIREKIMKVDRVQGIIPEQDRRLFLEMRERHFSDELSAVDLRRIDYFVEMYIPDDEIVF